MKYKTKTKILFSLVCCFLFFLSFSYVLAASSKYTPMENIPGFENAGGDFAVYMTNIYKFGVWAIGIAALLMISVGAFSYLTSAGNNAQMGKAKEIITNAIIGVVMALTAYLLLYTINPDLVKIKSISNGGSGSGNENKENKEECINNCEKSKCKDMVDEELSECSDKCKSGCNNNSDGDKICNDGKCTKADNAINNNSSNINPSTLKSIVVAGEGCNPANSSDGLGSCGYSQALPKIRKWCGITDSSFCSKVQSGDSDAIQTDINCAAKLIKDNEKRCGTDIRNVASCYNSGKPNNCAKTTKDYCGRVEKYYNNCNKSS
ncbi:MAG TPA: pilin [Candidatus Moranbacteria bacterium]|nr:pilin [Candidatus Moranbacteria bacterium]